MKFVKYLLILAVCCILLGAGSIYGLYKYIEPQLPDVATLRDVRLQIPMQVYSADGELMAQYGETPYPADLKPNSPVMVKAFIATEDSRFTSTTALTGGDFPCRKRCAVLRACLSGAVPLRSSWRVTSSSALKRR